MASIAALQMTSSPDVDTNFQKIHSILEGMQFHEPLLLVLPECFAFFGGSDREILAHAELPHATCNEAGCKIQSGLQELAKKYGIWLVAGTIPMQTEDKNRFTASSFVYDDTGAIRAEYQKIHMFDVEVADGTGSYRESRFTQPGNSPCVVPDTPFGRLGVAVCYDIRFPGQFAAMGDFDVLALPAAFTQKTGEAHWHKLLAARSIENQCYVVAANQSGTHANKRQTYGHSCIYSPWGELLGETLESPGFVFSGVNTSYLEKIRATMPVQQQTRFRSKFV